MNKGRKKAKERSQGKKEGSYPRKEGIQKVVRNNKNTRK